MSGDLEDGAAKGQQWGLCMWTSVGGKLVNGPFLGPQWEDVHRIHRLISFRFPITSVPLRSRYSR